MTSNKGFRNPDYQPKDFTELQQSDLGKQLNTIRLVDKMAKMLRCARNEIPEKLKNMTNELAELKKEKECLKMKILK